MPTNKLLKSIAILVIQFFDLKKIFILCPILVIVSSAALKVRAQSIFFYWSFKSREKKINKKSGKNDYKIENKNANIHVSMFKKYF